MRLFDSRRGRDAATTIGADLPQADPVAIEGYDRLAERKIIARLPQLSQAEMATVETYERAHAQRTAVLEKLRYLRSDEPLSGYDALSREEISAALRNADLTSLDRVRFYERRLQNRDSVLIEIEGLRERFRRPAEAHRSAPADWG